jgi:hypothetical protein
MPYRYCCRRRDPLFSCDTALASAFLVLSLRKKGKAFGIAKTQINGMEGSSIRCWRHSCFATTPHFFGFVIIIFKIIKII